jgi:hypothetical protein
MNFMLSLERGVRILEIFGEPFRWLTLTEVAKLINLTKTSTQRFLHTLHSIGYLNMDENKRYSFSFCDKGYDDPGMSELVKKVELVGGKGRDKLGEEVTLHDGKQYRVEGGGDEMLTPGVDKTRVKFESHAYDFSGKKRLDGVIDIVLNLDEVENIQELTWQLVS